MATLQRVFGHAQPKNVYIAAHTAVAFDQAKSTLLLRPGEEMVLELVRSPAAWAFRALQADVEDTKAGKGERGHLMITTYRVIWASHSASINLSIGIGTVHKLTYKGGFGTHDVKPVTMLTRHKTNSFEFVFTPDSQAAAETLIATLENLRALYLATSFYRELRLRANVTVTSKDGSARELSMLPDEQLHDRLAGVMNLSQEHGQIGVLWITSLRVAWAATLQDNFNCSVPYFQLKSARTRSSKFGQVLVLETHPEAGPKYLLGFQVAPKERLAEVVATIDVLLQMHITSPNSGVHAAHISDVKGMSREALDVLSQENDVSVENPVPSDAFAAYYATGSRPSDEPPVFDEYIGLTVEAMPPEVDLQTLWSVL